MERDDATHRLFLTELEALQKHRIGFLSHAPNTPLDLDDPDVSRIIEALAFFSARTREIARRGVVDVTARIFRQHFEQLLDPVPASVRVEAVPQRGFADIVHVPAGTELVLSKGGDRLLGTQPREVCFQTTTSITVLPLKISRVSAFQSPGERGLRIAVTIESPHERSGAPAKLKLDIDHFGDFHASSLLRYALRRSLERASVVFDADARRDAFGEPVDVAFGAPEPTLADLRLHDTPLGHVRAFLQNPWLELALTISLPEMKRNWKKLTLYFDVTDAWPNELVLRPDSFRLNTVGAVNIRHELARPIEHDGTRDRHRLMHNDRKAGFVPCSVLGVYRFTKDGLAPMRSATVSPGPGSYELTHSGRAEERDIFIDLDLPSAFEQPEKVSVDVLWHQPLFGELGTFGFDAKLGNRFLSNVDWSTVGEVARDAEPLSPTSAEELLRLVAIKGQKILGLDDVRFLLDVLGVGRSRYFSAMRDSLSDVSSRQIPYGKSAGGMKWIYTVTFRDLDVVALPRLDMFAPRLLEVLEAWSSDEVVELEVVVPDFELRETYVSPETAG